MKIRTEHVFPPIPIRQFDWSAVDDDTYDGPGSPVGTGPTEQVAIALTCWNKLRKGEFPMYNLIDLVDRVLARLRTGKCAVEFSDSCQNGSLCNKELISWCGDCGAELCLQHVVVCCASIRCPSCQGLHKVHHEWMKRQPEFKA
jgi:hypothetical protein